MLINTVKVTSYDDQKPGTSGLRKKTKVWMEGTYLANFVQSYFNVLGENTIKGSTLFVGGDGRYFMKEAIRKICEIAAASGVAKIWTGVNGLCSTPAGSAIIRERNGGEAIGGILLTASHNQGGIDFDFGMKFNDVNGAPASDSFTNAVYNESKSIAAFKYCEIAKLDLGKTGEQSFFDGKFKVEVIDTTEDWLKLMKNIFDFNLIRKLVVRNDFSMVYDCMNGVAAHYAEKLLVDELGLDKSAIIHNACLEDFGGLHPDPNLKYADKLVDIMKIRNPEKADSSTPIFGAAGDGDCDRNMILGKGFFVTPSDSVAIIASYAKEAIPYFKDGLTGVCRSMATSAALDRVASHFNIPCYETPTGWKYFGNLMNGGKVSICGEESFGTGSDHIREKDGLWAVLAWLSILAFRNMDNTKSLVTVQDIVHEFWFKFGRNYYSRYDYEEVSSDSAKNLLSYVMSLKDHVHQGQCHSNSAVLTMDNVKLIDSFSYKDPVDGSISENQGIRILFKDQSRLVWRLSGTGSVGATVRLYIEKYENDKDKLLNSTEKALEDLISFAVNDCQIQKFTGREAPTVIT